MFDRNAMSGLPESVLRLDKSIRHCEIIDRSGGIVVTNARKDLEASISGDAQYKQALQAAIRHFITPSWAIAFGEKFYAVDRYEKQIIASIIFSSDYLMLVSLIMIPTILTT